MTKQYYTTEEAMEMTGAFIREQAEILRQNLRDAKKGVIESEYV